MTARSRPTARSLAAAVLLAAAGLAAAGPADPWRGTWNVDAGGHRIVEVDREAALDYPLPAGGPIRLTGRAWGDTLRLSGRVEGRRGAVQALDEALLQGPPAEGPEPLEVTLVARRADDDDGEATVTARVELVQGDARRTRTETWRRPGPARLELIGLEPAGEYAPKADGPLRVRVRVLGAPQALRLRVVLRGAGGKLPDDVAARSTQERALGFYREQGTYPIVAEVTSDGVLPTGERALAWDGRDATAARRLVLQGRYRLVVEATRWPGRVAGERVPRPRVEGSLEVAAPTWRLFGPRQPGDTGWTSFGVAASDLVEAGYTTDAFEGLLGDWTRLLADLDQGAGASLTTHGRYGALLFGLEGRGLVAASTPTIRESLEARAARDGAPANAPADPLGDVLAVVVYACLTGSAGADDRAHRLPTVLVDLGVDHVVSFTHQVLVAEHAPFQEGLADLLRAGATLEQASRETAAAVDAQYWARLSELSRRVLREGGAAPLREALIFDSASGVDPAETRLIPARHGDSTN